MQQKRIPVPGQDPKHLPEYIFKECRVIPDTLLNTVRISFYSARSENLASHCKTISLSHFKAVTSCKKQRFSFLISHLSCLALRHPHNSSSKVCDKASSIPKLIRLAARLVILTEKEFLNWSL